MAACRIKHQAGRGLETHALACCLLVNTSLSMAQTRHHQILGSLLNSEWHGVQTVALAAEFETPDQGLSADLIKTRTKLIQSWRLPLRDFN